MLISTWSGCRFATSFRAIVDQGRVAPGEWVAVHGCGGVGLSAVMIAKAHEARVIAVDIDPAALDLAMAAGADTTIDSSQTDDVVAAVRELADGGVQLSVDALGSRQTCFHSIACLAKRGRHVQVGLMAGDDYRPPLPMELVIANELEIIGSHGMPAHAYGRMIDMMVEGKLDPGLLIRQTVNLERAAMALGDPGALHVAGVTVIDRFSD
jgi:alcohol dehydrogenase